MTSTSMNYVPAVLLEEVKRMGFGLYSEVVPSAVGIPMQTRLSDEEWEQEAKRLITDAHEIGKREPKPLSVNEKVCE